MSRAVLIVIMATLTPLLANCGPGGTDADSGPDTRAAPLTAATLGEQTILSTKDHLAQDRYVTADTDRGEALATQCRACHTLERGGADVLGPNLFGLFGRPAGSAPGYSYSGALAAGGFFWTPRALDAWLARPLAFLPGNRMSYPGLPDSDDRDAVIAYLLQYTDMGAGSGS